MQSPSLGRLLVVDDEVDLMETLCERLKERGYEVLGFSSSRKALAVLGEQDFDLLLCDLMMPQMDGIALLKAGLEIDPHLMGIVMTGQGTIQTAVEALRIGATDYILKPFKVAELLPVLSRGLELRRLRLENIRLRQTAAAVENARLYSERQRAEAELREGEHRYRALFENMLEGYAYCKMLFDHGEPQDFIYLTVNKVFEQLTGLKDVAGKKVSEVIPGIKESNPELFEIYGRVSLTGMPERFEVYVAPLGIWFSVAVYSPGKEYFIAIFDNITDRKKAEEALKLFRTLIDRSNDAIEVLDPETGRVLDINEKGCLDLGYSREEFLALSVFDIDPMVDQSSFTRAGEELRESGSLLWEGTHRRKDGSIFPVEVNIKYVQLDRDYLVTVVRDISERKRQEQALRASQEYVRNIIESSMDMIITVDTERRIIEFNRAAQEDFGYGREEVPVCVKDFETTRVLHLVKYLVR